MKTARGLHLCLAVIGVAAAPIVLGAMVMRFGVNIPYMDQWSLVPTIQELNGGSLKFEHLFAQHLEHRILFPRIVMLVLASSTYWDIRVELWANIVLALGFYLFLLLLIRNTLVQLSFPMRLWIAVLTSWLIFSPIQWENWLWGWQLAWYLLLFCMGGAIWTIWAGIEHRPLTSVVVGALFALVGSFSLANGLYIWWVCLPILWVRRAPSLILILWTSAGAATFSGYVYGYVHPAVHPPVSLFLKHPLDFVQYALIYLGGGLATSTTAAMICGVVFLFLATMTTLHFCRKKGKLLTEAVPWIAFGLFGVLSALMTALGRIGFGITQATSSRYATISLVWIVAVIILSTMMWHVSLASTARRRGLMRGLFLFGNSIILILIANGFFEGVRGMRHRYQAFRFTQLCLSMPRPTSECLLSTFPDERAVRIWRDYLTTIGWGGLPHIPPTYVDSNEEMVGEQLDEDGNRYVREHVARCFVDTIGGRPRTGDVVVLPRSVFTVVGWMVGSIATGEKNKILVLLRATTGIGVFEVAGTRQERLDVADHFSNPAHRFAGFEARGSLRDVPPGSYEFLVMETVQGQAMICRPGVMVEIRD